MKQIPNKWKYKKVHKANNFYKKTKEKKLFCVMNGQYGLLSLEAGKIKFKQIESVRRTFKRGKLGKLFIKIFCNTPVTTKPIASRMGKGKGKISYWISIIKKGQVIFEMSEIENKWRLNFLLTNVKNKLPIKTKIIKLLY